MNKAFVKEDDLNEDVRFQEQLGDAPRYVTPEGYARLEREAAELAASHRTPAMEQRFRFVGLLLRKLTIVPPRQGEARVVFGAWITVEDEEGTETTYRIVGPDEVDASRHWVSVDSPVARALLGKTAGAGGLLRTPRKGDLNFVISRVAWNPDDPLT